MILHNFNLSSASYRVRIALNLKGLAYQTRNYVLRSGEQRSPDYIRINPAGLVPTLEVEGRYISQSLAIIDFLGAKHPTPPLLPADAFSRAEVLEVALAIACDIHPLNNLRVLEYLEHEVGLDQPTRATWYAEWVGTGLGAIEARLASRPLSEFAFGKTPSLADICIVPQVFNARRFGVDLSSFPRLVAVADHALEHSAFAAATPILMRG